MKNTSNADLKLRRVEHIFKINLKFDVPSFGNPRYAIELNDSSRPEFFAKFTSLSVRVFFPCFYPNLEFDPSHFKCDRETCLGQRERAI